MGYANLTHDLSPKFASTSKDGGGGWGTGVRDRRRRALSPYKLNPEHRRQSEKSRSDQAFQLIRHVGNNISEK